MGSPVFALKESVSIVLVNDWFIINKLNKRDKIVRIFIMILFWCAKILFNVLDEE